MHEDANRDDGLRQPGHHHGHDHGHHHGRAPTSFGRAFAVGIGVNSAFVAIEVVCGFYSNSVALLADAGHNLSDVLGLALAWGAVMLTKRPATARFTYGLKGSSILAALFNAILLLLALGALALEAIQRLLHPSPVATGAVVLVALAGIIVNGMTALLFASGRNGDLNVRGAFLHMLGDAAISAGVVATALVVMASGWLWLDAAASLAIAVLIVWGTWGLLRDSLAMSLAGVPRAIATDAVEAQLARLEGVTRVHDLHIWPMSTTETALTAHLVMPGGHPGDLFLARVMHDLDDSFGIAHSTLQIEVDETVACALEPCRAL